MSIKSDTIYQLERIAAILVDYLQPVVVTQLPVNVDHSREWSFRIKITLILLILRYPNRFRKAIRSLLK